MNQKLLERCERYAKQHSTPTQRTEYNTLLVYVPWTHRDENGRITHGEDEINCRSFADVRDALGY